MMSCTTSMHRVALLNAAAQIATDMTQPDPEARLTRTQAAAALTDFGYPTSASTLATKATRGGGPMMRKFGPRVLYRWSDLVAWAESKTSAPRHSTSEPLRHNAA